MLSSDDLFGAVADASRVVRDGLVVPGAQIATSILNAGEVPDAKIECIDEVSESRLHTAYFAQPFAWPGVIVGTSVGVTGVVLVDNTHTVGDSFKFIYNAGEAPDARCPVADDKRHAFRQYFIHNAPGAIIGWSVAAVVVTAKDNFWAVPYSFRFFYNLGEAPEQSVPEIKDDRHVVRQYFPHQLPGALLGGSVAVTAGFFKDNVIATGNAFTGLYNLGEAKESQVDSYNDARRHEIRKYSPHILPGAIVGGSAAVVAVMSKDNFWAIPYSFRSIYNLGEAPNSQIAPIVDNRHVVRQYSPHQLPGALVGGSVAAVVVTAKDNFWAIPYSFRFFYNLGEAPDQSVPEIEDHRHVVRQYFPHQLPGALLGGSVAITAGFFKDNVIATGNTFAALYNLGEAPMMRASSFDDAKRHGIRKYSPHNLPGAIVGGSAAIVAVTLKDNIFTIPSSFISIYNLGETPEHRISEIKDDRHVVRKYFPHQLPGAIIGGAVGLTVSTIKTSVHSGLQLFSSIYNAGLDDSEKIKCISEIQDDKRHPLKKYGPLAWPGLLAGGLVGTGISILSDNIRNFSGAMTSVINTVLKDEDKIKCMSEITEDKRHGLRKYGPLGWGGLILGGLVGGVAACGIYAKRFAVGVGQSWKAASGSIMNVAIDRHKFNGVAGDKELGCMRTVARVVGYVSAACTTGIAGIITWAARKVPDLLAIGFGIGFSPLFALGKLCGKLFGKCCCNWLPRFSDSLISSANDVEQKFKNIFSSLTAMGKLNTGSPILNGQTGSDPWGTTARKVFTLNADNSTEKTLDAILQAFRNSSERDVRFFASPAFQTTVDSVKQTYSNDCFLSEKMMLSRCKEVEEVASFVKSYMERNQSNVPVDFYSRQQKSWYTLFTTNPPGGPALTSDSPRANARLASSPIRTIQVSAAASDEKGGGRPNLGFASA